MIRVALKASPYVARIKFKFFQSLLWKIDKFFILAPEEIGKTSSFAFFILVPLVDDQQILGGEDGKY